MADLNSDIVIEELVILLKNFMSSFKVRSEFKWTSISKLSKSMNSSSFFIIGADFVSRKGIHFIFTVRVKTEIVFLSFLFWLPKFACCNDFTNNVVKNVFKLLSNSVSN